MGVTVLDVRLSGRTLLFLFLLSILPFFALKFGVGNQIEQFSIIARILDPGFAPNDFFLDSAAVLGQPRYYYSWFIAGLTKIAPLDVVIYALMVVTGVLLGAVTYVTARRFLNASAEGAAIAAMLALLNLGMAIGYAGYLVFSNYQPATLAIALSLAGVLYLACNRVAVATGLFLLAALVHPTIGAEVAVIGYGAVLVANAMSKDRAAITGPALGGVVFLIGLALAWAAPNLGADGVKISSNEFMSILIKFRAPHHYLGLDFSRRHWLEAVLFVLCVGWILAAVVRAGAWSRYVSVLAAIVSIVLALCVLSLYFVDMAESRLWATAQLFRLVFLLKWVGYLLIGWMAGRWLENARPSDYVLVAVMVLPSASALPYAVAMALAARFVIARFVRNDWLALLITLPVVAKAAEYQLDYGSEPQTLRLLVAGCALILLSAPRFRSWGGPAATALVSIFIAAGLWASAEGWIAKDKFRTELTLAQRANDGTQIALMARDIGSDDAMWIVPPKMEDFRYVARRAVVVDFTSVPFRDAELREWRRRMEVLYGGTEHHGFGALRDMTAHYRSDPPISVGYAEFGAEYAVLFSDTAWDGAVLAENDTYKIVQLPR